MFKNKQNNEVIKLMLINNGLYFGIQGSNTENNYETVIENR